MSNELDQLTQAARQLIAIEQLFGGDFMPAQRRPLPEIVPRLAGAGCPAGASAAAGPAAAGRAAAPAMTVEQKAAALAEIDANEVKGCVKCRLAQGRRNTVFGETNPDARLMFIGEAPGEDEDRTGRPFVGRAGELLNKMIAAMGLRREEVFIANTVKCRPPNNRAPMPDEIGACWDYLVRQIRIIQPAVIVTLGNPATHSVLNTTVGITRMRGTWQRLPQIAEDVGDIPVMPTFHPAYLLRQYTNENRGMVWSDLQQVMQFLGLPLPQRPAKGGSK